MADTDGPDHRTLTDPAAASWSAEDPSLARGRTLGRYLLLNRLGAGGMGVVYAAYDPDLDRKLAIKVLRLDRLGDEARARLAREAQVLARLQHPNVVAVFDVGTAGEHIFLAMELVDGQSLRRWLDETPPWPRVLDAFVQAGRGLAAAHAAGIVHRDFKPDNVILGSDGRARVLDFGLARPANTDAAPAAEPPGVDVGSTATVPLSPALTRSGSLMGTPRYMSPEQWQGRAVDARSDQFSFCVALYEAAFGRAPFEATSTLELAEVVMRGSPEPPPKSGPVPARVREAILRGLSREPDARFPSMEALLDAIAPAAPELPSRRGMALFGAVLALALVAAGGVAWKLRVPPCPRDRTLGGAWTDARRQAVHAAFTATGVSWAEDAFTSAARALDAYAERWGAMRTDACEATRVRHEQSTAALELRTQCLADRQRRAEAVIALFQQPDEALLSRAAQAVLSVPDVELCGDLAALKAPVEPPSAAARARAEAVRGRLAHASALLSAGRYDAALPDALAAQKDADAFGYAPLQAETALVVDNINVFSYKVPLEESRTRLLSACAQAERGHDDLGRARCLFRLMVNASDGGHFQDGLGWGQLALAAYERVGGDETLRGDILVELGLASMELGDLAGARRSMEAAVASRRADPRSWGYGRAVERLSLVAGREGHIDEALRLLAEAKRAYAASIGTQHPMYAAAAAMHADTLLSASRADEAVVEAREALALVERVLGRDHPRAAVPTLVLGSALRESHHPDEALPYLERAVAMSIKDLGPDHPQVARRLMELARTQVDLHRTKDAVATYERALAIAEKAKDDAWAVEILGQLGETLVDGEPAHAVTYLERALALQARHPDQADNPQYRYTGALVRFSLARALWPRDRNKSRATATAAHDTFVALGAEMDSPKQAKLVADWLAGHR